MKNTGRNSGSHRRSSRLLLFCFGGFHHMLHQHTGGDAAHPSGNRSDGSDNTLHFRKAGISCNAPGASGCNLIRVPIDGHIDDHLPGADELTGQGVQHPGSGEDDIRLTAEGGSVGGFRMAEASLPSSSMAAGFPTTWDRPITTADFPRQSMP